MVTIAIEHSNNNRWPVVLTGSLKLVANVQELSNCPQQAGVLQGLRQKAIPVVQLFIALPQPAPEGRLGRMGLEVPVAATTLGLSQLHQTITHTDTSDANLGIL